MGEFGAPAAGYLPGRNWEDYSKGDRMLCCPRCRGSDITEIAIDLKPENDIKFYSCRLCEEKWWEREGGVIRLEEVIDLTAAAGGRR